jgi:outer membrane autotransporter protein
LRATTGQLFADAAYPMLTENGPLEPFAGLAWVRTGTDGFAETGGAAALTSSDSIENVGYSTAGIRAATTPQKTWWGITVAPRGSLAWLRAFGDLPPSQAGPPRLALLIGG